MRRISLRASGSRMAWDTPPVRWALLVLACAFMLDIAVPTGIAVGVMHAGAVALVLVGRDRFIPFVFACAGTALCIVGWAISDAPDGGGSDAIWNRLLSIATIWVVYAASLLRESSAQRDAALLIDSTAEGIYGLDRKGRCTFANEACLRMLGYEYGDLIGQHMHDLVHHTSSDGHHQPVEACTIYKVMQENKGTYVPDDIFWRKDKTPIPVEFRSYPVRERGRVAGAVVSFTDTSARRNAEETAQKRTRMLESLTHVNTSLAAELDADTLLQQVTEAGCELTEAAFGAFFFSDLDKQGSTFLRYTVAGTDGELFEGFGLPGPTALFGPTFRGEGVIRLDDVTKDPRYSGQPTGHPLVRSYLGVPVIARTGTVLGGLIYGHREVGVFDETSEELVVGIAAQAAVAIENARLYRAAHEASQQKDEFLAMLAHELRNPLQPLRMSVGLLDGALDPESTQEIRDMIDRQVRQMSRLIDDLLDVARISRGKINLQKAPCSMHEIVQQAIEATQPMFDRLGHHLNVTLSDPDLWVQGDQARLVQTVSNLLDNAAKYSNENGSVDLAVDQADGEVHITIVDQGTGIEPEVLHHIWELFVQAKTELSRSLGGLGLGLHLVHRLVAKHGGRVAASSSGEGQGSTFEIWLPQIEAPALTRSEPDPAPALSHRILVVDDHPDAVRGLSMVLRRMGHDVHCAADGPEGLMQAEAHAPEVAILDIGLPGMDGYELAERLRAMPNGPKRIIALSGYGDPASRKRSKQAGFDVHLLKPAMIDDIKACLEAPQP